jgi:predicted DNA-binding protein
MKNGGSKSCSSLAFLGLLHTGVLQVCQKRVTLRIMGMKGITIKLSDRTLRRLRHEARETGRSVAALVRERVEALPDQANDSVFALTSDIAGSLMGGRRPAANTRRRFRRS